MLPAVLVFGLGLSATVAPLTATVLDSVEERHVGIASGVNNGVARVAGLLAIAVLGAVISAKFDASVGRAVGSGPLTADAPDASTAAFHLGIADRRPADDRRRDLRRLRNRESRAAIEASHPRRRPGRRVRPRRRLRRAQLDPAPREQRA